MVTRTSSNGDQIYLIIYVGVKQIFTNSNNNKRNTYISNQRTYVCTYTQLSLCISNVVLNVLESIVGFELL